MNNYGAARARSGAREALRIALFLAVCISRRGSSRGPARRTAVRCRGQRAAGRCWCCLLVFREASGTTGEFGGGFGPARRSRILTVSAKQGGNSVDSVQELCHPHVAGSTHPSGLPRPRRIALPRLWTNCTPPPLAAVRISPRRSRNSASVSGILFRRIKKCRELERSGRRGSDPEAEGGMVEQVCPTSGHPSPTTPSSRLRHQLDPTIASATASGRASV